MSFKRRDVGEIAVWTGDPDCSAAMAVLETHLAATPIPKLASGRLLTNTQVGSLGEALAFLVGRASTFPESTHRVLAENCGNPLAGGSKTGLDILWIAFHPDDSRSDHAWIQEVKTTTDVVEATYLKDLKGDYNKLFLGRPGLTLEDRLWDAAFRLHYAAGQADLARRVRALGARSAPEVTRVSLVPTGVHDSAAEAVTVIEQVRATLIEDLGWSESQVAPVLISVTELGTRLQALVTP